MGNRVTLLLLVLVLCYGVGMAMGYREEEDWRREREERGKGEGEDWFLLQDSKHVVKTDAGDMRVVKSLGGRIIDRPMHIGFIRMEPKTLFIPQYIDSTLIIFVRRGEAKVGCVYKDELVERRLKMGDLYRIPAGSPFYLVNTGEGQRLHIICSIDNSESLGLGVFQSFFIGGGTNPKSVLAGFDPETLRTAFNVTGAELGEIMTRQQDGPIVYISESHPPSIWTKFLQLREEERLQHLKRMVEPYREEEQPTWSWRKLLNSVFGQENAMDDRVGHRAPDSYNLYKKRPDFRNKYGWSVALDESDYTPLRHSGIGVFLVNLTAGSMMAPHVNPTATEYGIILRGTGTIQIVFPNGTTAMNAEVKEGDVFWVPRYFPFCQIASRAGPLEFFGFTTSARKNRPQFLVGANSVLHALRSPELAAAFGVSEKRIQRFLDAQREAVILPGTPASPPGKDNEKKVVEKVIRSFGSDLVMGFD
ncbi:Cupin_1 domain-containing protein [Cephalotus follicularis]|uniref:Cupin_1 domain-containing protein n=1 Tax=Cephalotus follicularis TaxID=3775 RepID=A0A1Q3B294_CEPFO|nr:Cupin_1 domain-containing protein [Cephalotus follicularis]